MVSEKDWRAFRRTCWALVAIGVVFLTLQKACAQTQATISAKTKSFVLLKSDEPRAWVAMQPLDLELGNIDTSETPKLLIWTGKKLEWFKLPTEKYVCLVPTPSKPATLIIDEMAGTVGAPSWVHIRHSIKVTDDGQDDETEDDETEDEDTTPDANPVPSPDGLRVLIVYESEEPAPLLYNGQVRNWLTSNCIKENRQPAFRVYDQHAVFPNGSDSIWQAWMGRPRESIPWIIIANGKSSFEGPLPQTPEAFIQLVEKYK